MSERFDLRSRFETDGLFWNPETPDRKFPAHLTSDGRRIELTTAAEMCGFREFFSQSPASSDVLYGFTTMGRCTLIHVSHGRARQNANFQTLEFVSVFKYRVDACVIGCYLQNDADPLVAAAWSSYTGIGDWFPPTVMSSVTEELVTVAYPRAEQVLLDFCVVANRTRIKITVYSGLKLGLRRHRAASEPHLTIEPVQPTSVQQVFATAIRLENFFSLCLGTSIRLQTLFLQSTDGQEGWLVLPHLRGKADKTDPQVWIRADASPLAAAIAFWLSAPEEFRPVENLVYGTVRHSSLFVETEFLSLAQAVESFHRLTENTRVVDVALFKKTLKQVVRFIEETSKDSPITRRLLDGIRSANEPSFKNRIEALLNRIDEQRATRLLGDLADFEQTLRQTRNYLTHLGIKRQARVLTGAKELYLFNQKLHAFLRLLMLVNAGFQEDAVFEPVFNQSRRWS